MNLELFPCSGGMSEGFRRAGIEFDMAIDHDLDACNSHERNLGLRPVQMDVGDFLRMVRAGWRPAEGVRLVVADPPCTPWSRAGKRQGLADERDCLRETAELIALLKPECYLIGNVPGLQDASSWHVVQEVIGGLAKHGYCVADYVQLDAADYGVPQHRIRPFWYGHQFGECIRWPAPSHGPVTRTPSMFGDELKTWVTCREALSHLPLEELGRPIRQKENRKHQPVNGDAPSGTLSTGGSRHQSNALRCDPRHPPARLDGQAPTIRSGGNGHSAPQVILKVGRSRRPFGMDGPSATVTTRESANTAKINHRLGRPDESAKTLTQNTHSDGSYLEWPWDRPATTVFAGDERIMPPGHHEGSNLSGPNAIALSERAAGILQGFPDGWVFSGKTKKARWSQIGQAMPPPLAEAVARAVRVLL